ncbi:O-antigen ligase family protein [Paucibacter soli]|uniref:O-antigen ligase family protein n=1 Tax=Paucibacter soli TaxID=3133433 RepID=UPI003097A505
MSVTRWACGLYLLTLPFIYQLAGGNVSAHDFARIAQLPLLALAVLELVVFPRRETPTFSSSTGWLLVCMGLLASASVLGSAHPLAAIREVTLLASLLVLSVVIGRAPRHWTSLNDFALAAMFSYAAVLLMVMAAMLATGHVVLMWDLPFGFDNPRFFNHVQTAAIPLLAGLSLHGAWSQRIRSLALVALTGQLFLLQTTTGRATMTALVVAGTVVMLTLGPRSLPWVRNMVLCAALALVAYLLLSTYGPGLSEMVGYQLSARELGSAHSRDYLWNIAFEHIRSFPLLGVGPMHFAHQVNAKGAHPHNAYLQLAAEFGVPFAVAVIYLGFRCLRFMVLQLRASTEPGQLAMGVGLFASCVAIAVDALFSGNLVMPNSQIWCFAVFGMSWGWCQDVAQASAQQPPVKPAILKGQGLGHLFRYGLLAMVLWMNLASLSEFELEVPRLVIGHSDVGDGMVRVNAQRRPRFWSEGWF